MTIVGWDIGGVNTKAAVVADGSVVSAVSKPFEIRKDPEQLTPFLRSLLSNLAPGPVSAHAVTMTAELSQAFRTKREGVAFVLNAVEKALTQSPVHVFTVDGAFVASAAARTMALRVAAANWMATAAIVAEKYPDAVLIDIGTTTTDIIPIVGGRPVPAGTTDPERLASGELVYTGAVRTPVEAVSGYASFRDGTAGVAAEGFALMGDVHVYRGFMSPDDYTAPTPDNRPVSRPFAAERLARSICGDLEMLTDDDVSRIANGFAFAQRTSISSALHRILGRHPTLTQAVVTGVGSFIAEEVAVRAGLRTAFLATDIGSAAARSAPAAAVALLLERTLRGGQQHASTH